MNHWMLMLMEASVIITFFYGFYYFFLRKETFFMANRFYLLFSAVFSLIIPWLSFSISTQPNKPVTKLYNVLETITVTANGYESRFLETLSAWQWVLIFYIVGVILFLLVLLFKIITILQLERKALKVTVHQGWKLVIVQEKMVPFSFLNRMYVPESFYTNEQIHKIMAHEKIHIIQKHTMDCLFYECLIVLFWFHPIVYRYRTSAKEIHEYLADQGAIRSGIEKYTYQELLFAQATGLQVLSLPNSFNYSLIKRRLLMLSKIKSSKIASIKFVVLIPFLAVVMVVFACNKATKEETVSAPAEDTQSSFLDGNDSSKTVYNPETNTVTEINNGAELDGKSGEKRNYTEVNNEKIYFIADEMPQYPGGEGELRNFIAQQVKYPVDAKEKGIQGKVFVTFNVDKNGKVCDVTITKGVHPLLDEEAIRVVKAMPEWKPGKDKGNPVKVSFTVPINFKLS